MSDFGTAAVTVIVGVAVFVLGNFIQKAMIDPIQQQLRTIGRIAYALIFYANVCATPGHPEMNLPETLDRTSRILRKLAAELEMSLRLIPFYGILQFVRIVPKRANVAEAVRCLIGWSNGIKDVNSLHLNDANQRDIAIRLSIKRY